VIPGLSLSEQDEMRLAFQLALRGGPESGEILRHQASRIKNPDRGREFDFILPSVSASGEVRDRFFESLKQASNRRHEPWVLEALSYLHHPLRAETATRYIRPSLDLLEELKTTGGIFFPKRWLDATFSGHNSEQAADIVRRFLKDHPKYPTRLKGKILQSADLLFRKATIIAPRSDRR
jgi:aminopeptidase N